MPDYPTFHGVLDTIGATPLIRLDRIYDRPETDVWAKIEGVNPGGSAKDRTAAALFADATENGRLIDVDSIIESTSGNLGIALARQALLAGLKFHCVADPNINQPTKKTMQALGATIHVVNEPDPTTGDWLTARKAMVDRLLKEIPRSATFDQYSNRAAFSAHSDGTMREIVDALGVPPDFLLVAMSTTGTIGGCRQYLRRIDAPTRVIGVDAEGSVLFGGKRGPRTLPGFGAGAEPELAPHAQPHEVVRISEIDSIVGARKLARSEGILPGASGGAVISALDQFLPTVPPGSTVAVVLHDLGHAYLDTVYDDEWVQDTIGVTPAELAELVSRQIGRYS